MRNSNERARSVPTKQSTTDSFPIGDAEVMRLTDGRGVDHVVELGGSGTLEKSFASARFGGNIWLIGVLTGFEAKVDPLQVLFKSLQVQGIYVGSREMFRSDEYRFRQCESATHYRPDISFQRGAGGFSLHATSGAFRKNCGGLSVSSSRLEELIGRDSIGSLNQYLSVRESRVPRKVLPTAMQISGMEH